jgi:hypothetical protein
VHPLARFLALLLLATAILRAGDGLEAARRAQGLLGPDIWSQVIRVENDARVSRYPRTLHALVFEVAGILWFYTATDGTQSFSLRVDRLAEEKADYGPLLRDIEPGFRRWRVIGAGERGRVGEGALPNGCFVESVAAWQALRAAGVAADQPRLLSYYTPTVDGVQGHTVLTYLTPRGVEVIDPTESGRPQLFSTAFGEDAVGLAQALEGASVARARWVPVELSRESRGTTRVAGGAVAAGIAAAPQRLAALR